MFDASLQFLQQLIGLMPALIGLYIVFDFVGSLLFGQR